MSVKRSIWLVSLTVLLSIGLAPVSAASTPWGEDFEDLYPATMTHSNQGLPSVCDAEDVFELRAFEFQHGSGLKIACKKCTVAMGHHQGNALWAVVFPDKPVKIRSSEPGDGETTSQVFLRFAPGDVGKLFPARTIKGRGDAWRRVEAARVFRHKIGWRWSTQSGNSTVVPAGVTIVDADTAEGSRRFYCASRNEGKLLYVADYEAKPVPAPQPIGSREALEVFDEVFETFDREYAMFVLHPKLKWAKLGKEARKRAAKAESTLQLGAVLADLLSNLEDLHVWVKAGDDFLPGYRRDRPLNGNIDGTIATLGGKKDAGKNLSWARTGDDIGYVNVYSLSDPDLPRRFDEVLEELGDTWGLVLDLRFNGGGGEDLAQQIAARFVDQERVYAKNQYRNGPKHSQLGSMLERRFAPRGPWRYESPVVVLWGRKTLSSAEAFALMMKQCPQATTMGTPTGGSTGNPRRLEFDCGIQVNMPRWVAWDVEGNPIERRGVSPEVELEFAPEAYGPRSDPLLEAALEHLRKIPRDERENGRR